ncbi:MAG: tetratricopeptide repeat protein, partial [Candidatus Marinimicrobia bacterium]|nr:tetratricopeptide repeat protein [Candidatus Neomarinimicrobiota bacterium]
MKQLAALSIAFLLLSSCDKTGSAYMGSRSCIECHERFYDLWENSHHARAMMDFDRDFAGTHLSPCDTFVTVGDDAFQYRLRSRGGFMVEKKSRRRYRISHVLGGKYVYYFLTPQEKGKLQTLPLGYDVSQNTWFDITSSGIRFHQEMPDEALPWTDRRYTFNTACFSCHVSQLTSVYDIRDDSYQTLWLESGINCETCHGPAEKHNRIFLEARDRGTVPDSVHLMTFTQSRGWDADIVNAVCSYCHAKQIPLTPQYVAGEAYFQHFDLVGIEHPDFYPDGRDLGENYTFTSWRMSPCVRNSKLDCLHCHTSSGRYRQKDDPNASCLPCHEARVANPVPHTYHKEGSPGNVCVSCHMPKTVFARMTRSDHSMRPPAPAATLAYESPNACNLCHTGKTPAWADSVLLSRYSGQFQSETLEWSSYLNALRQGRSDLLENTLAYLSGCGDEMIAAAIIRSLNSLHDERMIPYLLEKLEDPSPLVRASAAGALGPYLNSELIERLSLLCGDPVRLVRIRAAAELAGVRLQDMPSGTRAAFADALAEYRQSLEVFPDNEVSHYNLAHLHEEQQRFSEARDAYLRALRLRPEFTEAAVNLALLYYELGRTDSALYYLESAISRDPHHAQAHLNTGLLYAETGRHGDAVKAFQTSYGLDPGPVAAYNLAVLLSGSDPGTSL